MYSIAFPKMFKSVRTLTVKDHDATESNLKLLLASERETLFGDPDFGTKTRRYIFEQNNEILRDIIIDEIYTAIQVFMPQLQLTRNNITIYTDDVDVFAKIECLNKLDYQVDMYNINLTKAESQ